MKKILLSLLVVLTFSVNVKGQAYTSATIVTGLQMPVAFDVADDGRFFVTQKGDGGTPSTQGTSTIRVYDAAGAFLSTFYDLSDSVNSDFERGLLGIELDPDFTNNHYVYAYYNHRLSGDERIRIVRFTEASNLGTNPTIVFDLDVSNSIAGNHVGGNLHFRPSDPNHLYLTIGDLAVSQTTPSVNYANKLTNPYGKILRINLDGSAPSDNPFYDDGNPLATNCDWIWSYGHRNSFDFCFNPVTDSMYCSENGLNQWDEANIIHRGGFYGWANCEGNYMNSSSTNPCNLTGDVRPITVWGPGSPPAVTGIVFYTGSVWPALDNHLIVADNDFGRIYNCTMGNAPAFDTVTNRTQMGDLTTSGGLTTLKQSVDGCIFAMKGGYTTNGQIYKVCPVGIGIAENNTALNSLVVYPNPASGVLNIESTFLTNTDLNAELIDFSGRLVYTCEPNTMKGNKNTYSIDLLRNKIAKGIYFVQIKNTLTKEVMATTKVVVD